MLHKMDSNVQGSAFDSLQGRTENTDVHIARMHASARADKEKNGDI